MTESEAYIDVVELCGILQCLGFHVKSIDTNCDQNANSVARTVIVDCREFGSSILGSLPKPHRERLTAQLQDIVRCIKEHNEDVDKQKDPAPNRSASMIDMKTPEKRNLQLKVETPTRYRSLDTLTSARRGAEPLPAPGALLKHSDDDKDEVRTKCTRQSTYTLASTPDSLKQRNKTSSPIQKPSNSILESLIAAEKTAEELRSNLSNIIKELMEDGRYDSSSSLALDVSKISIMKVPDNSKIQFASSPNLSNLGMQEELTKRLKGVESASTSNLATKPAAKDAKTSKFRKLSPSLFKYSTSPKVDKDKQTNNKNSKLNSLFKPRIVTPVRAGTPTTDASPNLSGSKKKYSHIKSTIPRPATTKKE
ncbi:uncharacterized protein LOC123873814 isoform X2 [Maniola jurtina]|uniref:uncharacterized protein LOC123873814 isoform X2 n=1 Tax=Maniola jurtina TaxID=191418 RepID=UPI001E68F889|nr:uncharacterized protein LOC123873814 isoform X2 [Maniola jurtina]